MEVSTLEMCTLCEWIFNRQICSWWTTRRAPRNGPGHCNGVVWCQLICSFKSRFYSKTFLDKLDQWVLWRKRALCRTWSWIYVLITGTGRMNTKLQRSLSFCMIFQCFLFIAGWVAQCMHAHHCIAFQNVGIWNLSCFEDEEGDEVKFKLFQRAIHT